MIFLVLSLALITSPAQELRADEQTCISRYSELQKVPNSAPVLDYTILIGKERISRTGQLYEMELFPGYRIQVLKNQGGSIRLIDPDKAQVVLNGKQVSSAPKLEQPLPLENAKIDDFNLNPKRIYEEFCSHSKKIRDLPQHTALRMLADALRPEYREKLWIEMGLRCGGSYALLYPAMSRIYEDSKIKSAAGDTSPYIDHVSNFTLGLAFMSLADHCISGLHLAHREAILKATLGANVLANIYFEIGLGQTDFISEKVVSTDTKDFTSGLLSTLTYYSTIKLLEKVIGTEQRLKAYCK